MKVFMPNVQANVRHDSIDAHCTGQCKKWKKWKVFMPTVQANVRNEKYSCPLYRPM